MLEQVEAGERAQDLKMDVLQAIRYVIQGWNNVTAETIYNCWRHTGILPINTDIELDFPWMMIMKYLMMNLLMLLKLLIFLI